MEIERTRHTVSLLTTLLYFSLLLQTLLVGTVGGQLISASCHDLTCNFRMNAMTRHLRMMTMMHGRAGPGTGAGQGSGDRAEHTRIEDRRIGGWRL